MRRALQRILATRIARAAWRLERAERIETEMFDEHGQGDGSLALALIRDGFRSRSFDSLLRYHGSALAELWRALRTLEALQTEPAIEVPRPTAERLPRPETDRAITPVQETCEGGSGEKRNEPEVRENPGKTRPDPARDLLEKQPGRAGLGKTRIKNPRGGATAPGIDGAG